MQLARLEPTMPNEQITTSNNGSKNNPRESERVPAHAVARGDEAAQNATHAAGEKVREVGSSQAVSSLQSKAGELKSQIASKLPSDSIAHAADAARSRVESAVGTAREEASSLLDGARDRAAHSMDWAREQTAVARDRARDVAQRATGLAREGSHRARELAHEGSLRARQAGRSVGGFATTHAAPLAVLGLGLGWLAWSMRRERSREDRLVLVEVDYAALPTPRGRSREPYYEIPERPIGSIGYDDPSY
jgi:hypothetical protein